MTAVLVVLAACLWVVALDMTEPPDPGLPA